MSWFKVDDGLHSHPKAVRSGNAALGLWVRGGSWSSQHLTEGFIPEEIVRLYGTPPNAAALVQSGLWAKVPGGYQMHDYLDRNPTRDQVQMQRDAAAERQRAARDRAKASRRDSRVTHGVSHGVSHGGSHGPPDPTRPVTTEQPPTEVVATRKRAAPTRGTSAPDIFPLTLDLNEWARTKTPGVDLPEETENWLDWHRAKGDTAKDWTASWRTWMRRAQRDVAGRRPGRTQTSTTDQRVHDGLALVARFQDHDTNSQLQLGAS